MKGIRIDGERQRMFCHDVGIESGLEADMVFFYRKPIRADVGIHREVEQGYRERIRDSDHELCQLHGRIRVKFLKTESDRLVHRQLAGKTRVQSDMRTRAVLGYHKKIRRARGGIRHLHHHGIVGRSVISWHRPR